MTYEAFGLPEFSTITPESSVVQIREAIAQHSTLLASIASQEAVATVENTLVPFERGALALKRPIMIAWTSIESVGGREWEAVETEITPLLATHDDDTYLDTQLLGRFEALGSQDLDAETAWCVAEHLKEFRAHGAHLGSEDQARLRTLNGRMAELASSIGQIIVKAGQDGALRLSEEETAGLSEAERAGLAANAATNPQRAAGAPYLLNLTLPSQQLISSSFANPDTRQRIFEASVSRCDGHDAATDPRELIVELVRLRAEQAGLLGFENYAEFVASQSTAGSSEAVDSLLDSMVAPTQKNVEHEAQQLKRSYADSAGAAGTFAPSDWLYAQEALRASRFAIDNSELSNYLELWHVVEDGVFYAANRLYGLQFAARPDLAGYAEDVRVWEVREEDGTVLGLFLGDYYAREGKRGGAWMHEISLRAGQGNEYAIIFNNLNVTKPAPGEPTLLTWDQVNTCFHEFGHALHALLTDVEWPSAAGTNVPRDFVEFPSQVNEVWAAHPEVLSNYALHWQTGEPMPQRLREGLSASDGFAEGFSTSEILQAVLLDQAWHRFGTGDSVPKADEVEAFEQQTLQRAGVLSEWIPPRYRTGYFNHIFSSGYAAGYYSYLWSEALDADTVDWFQTEGSQAGDGGLNRAAGLKMRSCILSRGNSRNPLIGFEELRGRSVDTGALLRRRRLS
ncbi:MAG: M3 family metallopeptidase [Ancrocorticia populi]|uniref:M3 family metallopeptidase n=1 Tax=Ancrocorticia populi TaxID=2175228 RepID=UPI003F911F36